VSDLHIQSYPGNWEEVEDYDQELDDESPDEDRAGVWALVEAEDWVTLTVWLRAHGYLDDDEAARKGLLLRIATPNGPVDRLWVRVNRPKS